MKKINIKIFNKILRKDESFIKLLTLPSFLRIRDYNFSSMIKIEDPSMTLIKVFNKVSILFDCLCLRETF